MNNLESTWFEKIFEDDELKLKHFKVLMFLYKEKDERDYSLINIDDIQRKCKIKNTKTLFNIINILSNKGYIILDTKNQLKYKINFNESVNCNQKVELKINITDFYNDKKNFFINVLLNKHYIWHKVKKKKRYEIVFSYTEEEIKEYIKEMSFLNYNDFLLTPYWDVIKCYVKKKYKTCQICGSKKHLHIHHKTYEHHFFEHFYIEDMMLVCKECHQKIHNIN